MTSNQEQKLVAYLKKWNPFLLVSDNSDAHQPEERNEVNAQWASEIGAALDKPNLQGLVDRLIAIVSSPSQSEDNHSHMKYRAIITKLCNCPGHPYLGRLLGKIIADRLDIKNIPGDYFAPKGINLPWEKFPRELDQFAIETILLCLEICEERQETVRKWYCRQLIVLAACREDWWPIELAHGLGINVFQIWEELLIDRRVSLDIRIACNQQLCAWLTVKHSDNLVAKAAKMINGRLSDRDHSIGYEAEILEVQIFTLINAAGESKAAEKEVRIYLNEQAIGIALLAFGAGDRFRLTKIKLAKFYVSGGVRTPVTDSDLAALKLMSWELEGEPEQILLDAAISTKRPNRGLSLA